MARKALLLILSAALWSATGCGEDAPSGAANQPPSIVSITAPFFVAVPDSGVPGNDTLLVSATDPEDDVITVSLEIRRADGSPVEGAAPNQMSDGGTGADQTAGDNVFTAVLDESVINEEGGRYTLTFSIRDDQGNEGESLVHQILSGRNFVPVITSTSVPDSIVIPDPGNEDILFEVSASVEDPNGPFDVKSVTVEILPDAPGTFFPMFDDGDTAQNGDGTANDGVYTTGFSIGSGNSEGVRYFDFRAEDFSGAESTVVRDSVVFLKN